MKGSFSVLVLLLAIEAGANQEGEALAVFKDALVDPEGVLDSWDTSLVNPCTWLHITCDDNNFIIRIDLQGMSLRGSLVPDLAVLQHLQYLELNDNYFSGSIPSEIGMLGELISLDLYNNYLSGDIPDTLDGLSKLKFLRLNGNRLSGKIPVSLTKLSNLQVLDLSNNNLSGRIPEGGAFSRTSSVNFQGNNELCGPRVGRECT